MAMGRWSDECECDANDAAGPTTPARPIMSQPLGEWPVSFCRTCDAAFYTNAHGKPRRHCKSCYLKWSSSQGRTNSKRNTNSPASTRTDDSSEGNGRALEKESEEGLFKELERVVRHGVSFEAEAKPPPPPPTPPPPPPPPPPPVQRVPEPTNITVLLEQLSTQAPPPRPSPRPSPPPPPPPPPPTTSSVGTQTGLYALPRTHPAPLPHTPKLTSPPPAPGKQTRLSFGQRCSASQRS